MKADSELRRDVERELELEPSVDERRIGVAVLDGIVTLTGEARSYAERWQAERTAERVSGVRGVVNRLEVKPATERSDVDIARSAADVLKWNVLVPADRIKVRVENGWLSLEGDVEWEYQRRAAERAVRNIPGVKGISNLVVVKPRVQPSDVRRKIEEAFEREAIIDAQHIDVSVNGSEVTLSGRVRSWAERHEAEKAAWSVPGVTTVHNDLIVEAVAA